MPARRQDTEIRKAQVVAKRAGVSVMTVSRALRGMPNVAPKTRERILAIAEEVDYSPSLAARSLRTGIVEVVGFVATGANSLRGGYNSEMLSGMDYRMAEHGYHVLLMQGPTSDEIVRTSERVVKEGRVGGLVILGSMLSSGSLERIAQLKTPIVVLNFSDREKISSHVSTVCYDNFGGIEKAVRHLAALRHRHIAYIGGTREDRDAKEREEGFRATMEKLGLELREDWVRSGDFTLALESGNQEGEYLLSEGDRGPTAIVCASDTLASGVLQAVRRSGRRVPEDLSVVGFDNELLSRVVDPPLTTVDHDGWQLGCEAGEVMISLLTGDSEPKRSRLETNLVIRASTGKAPS